MGGIQYSANDDNTYHLWRSTGRTKDGCNWQDRCKRRRVPKKGSPFVEHVMKKENKNGR